MFYYKINDNYYSASSDEVRDQSDKLITEEEYTSWMNSLLNVEEVDVNNSIPQGQEITNPEEESEEE